MTIQHFKDARYLTQVGEAEARLGALYSAHSSELLRFLHAFTSAGQTAEDLLS